MQVTTFTAKELEDALESLKTIDSDFSDYPLVQNINDYGLWGDEIYPITLRKVGKDEHVHVALKEYFGGEEGGDHRMYIVLQVGFGDAARYFEKTGEYNSWDSSEWDGPMYEVEPVEVKKIEWSIKKAK